MKSYRLKLILKRFFKNKLNYVIVLLIGLSFAFSLLVNSLSYSATEFFKENILNMAGYRQYFIRVEDSEQLKKLEDKLKSMPNVVGYFDDTGYMSSWKFKDLKDDTEDDGLANIVFSSVASDVKADIGNDLTLSTDENYIICPSTYYSDPDKTVKIDLKPYIGKELIIKSIDEKYDDEFKVRLVGLFDNEKINKNYRRCFINYNNLSKISKDIVIPDLTHMYYEIDNIENEEKVLNELKKDGYWSDPIIYGDRSLALESISSLNFISKCLLIISIIIVFLIIYYNVKSFRNNLYIHRAVGYSNKDFLIDYIVEMMNIFVLSFISLCIFSIITLAVFRKIIPHIYSTFKNVKIIISPMEFLIYVLLLFLLCILIFIINYINNKNEYN